MNKIFTIVSLTLSMTANAQFEGAKKNYQVPNLTEVVGNHKTVAIIPFDAKITYKTA